MSTLLKQTDYFQTSDLALCAALCCHDYQIEKIDKQGQKAVFVIEADGRIESIIKSFWSHELKVDPLSYFNFLKEIKTRIYS